jgi:predicted nucleic acid-binding protein
MLAFFDTSIHIDLLRGARPLADVLESAGNPAIRLSPVVASELLRGVSGRGARSVARLVRGLVALEPPSWRSCWLETGRLLPRVFPHHEAIGLARLQNDLLLALTARYTGSLFVTGDAHFATLQRHVSFAVKVLPSAAQQRTA